LKTNKHIIFDFDGTISNSIAGIQHSYNYAFEMVFGEKNTTDLFPLIGPPIHLILQALRPQTSVIESNYFVQEFRSHYDREGHLMNTLYEGIEEVLTTLKEAENTLYIATFKRRAPLEKILEEYQMSEFFKDIYTYDKPDGSNYPTKTEMVSTLMKTHALKTEEVYMIGDSRDDAKAAAENNISFIFAEYGYGKDLPAHYIINTPKDILSIL
jgi:phosphoglycolate phosphatase